MNIFICLKKKWIKIDGFRTFWNKRTRWRGVSGSTECRKRRVPPQRKAPPPNGAPRKKKKNKKETKRGFPRPTIFFSPDFPFSPPPPLSYPWKCINVWCRCFYFDYLSLLFLGFVWKKRTPKNKKQFFFKERKNWFPNALKLSRKMMVANNLMIIGNWSFDAESLKWLSGKMRFESKLMCGCSRSQSVVGFFFLCPRVCRIGPWNNWMTRCAVGWRRGASCAPRRHRSVDCGHPICSTSASFPPPPPPPPPPVLERRLPSMADRSADWWPRPLPPPTVLLSATLHSISTCFVKEIDKNGSSSSKKKSK